MADGGIEDKRKIIDEYNIKATEEIVKAVGDIARSEEGLVLCLIPKRLKDGYKRMYMDRVKKETLEVERDILNIAESVVRKENEISDYVEDISDAAKKVVRAMLLFLSRNDFDRAYNEEMEGVALKGVRVNVRFYLKLLRASGTSYEELVRDGFDAEEYYDSLETISRTNWLVLMRSKDVIRENSLEYRVLQGTVVYIRSMHENEVRRFFADELDESKEIQCCIRAHPT
ncbi:MAG TPA: hypothetical protein ENF23_02525 [Methanosarcinales archaeon]|nr:MAG: hypothetical protein DRO03_02165 [Methanosarcinales archaeon]HDN65162.1 hypothetical protein [Methanosarcinales archaeon]